MKHKPLIFKILSFLFIIEPLIKVLYFRATTEFDFALIFENLGSRTSFKEIFDFWLVFPLAGISLFKIRKWSYFVFLLILLYIIVSFLTYEKYTWPYYSDSPLLYHYLVVVLALGIFSLFLIPQIREPFFNRKVRWWEAGIRYRAQIPLKVISPKMTFDSKTINISESGTFIQNSNYLEPGDVVTLQLEAHGISIAVPAMVINRHTIEKDTGLGLHFRPKSLGQKFRIYKLVQRIKALVEA
jgi:hypothetical protein